MKLTLVILLLVGIVYIISQQSLFARDEANPELTLEAQQSYQYISAQNLEQSQKVINKLSSPIVVRSLLAIFVILMIALAYGAIGIIIFGLTIFMKR